MEQTDELCMVPLRAPSPGPTTCAGYIGSYGHEAQDAKTFAAWGIDYLKYDWCGARMLYRDEDMPALYQIMGDALLATGRPIVYSLCQYGRLDVWKWGADVGGHSWRTADDLGGELNRIFPVALKNAEHGAWSKPGAWNDPDYIQIGYIGDDQPSPWLYIQAEAMILRRELTNTNFPATSLGVAGWGA